jgi:hypothetical protein
LRVRYLYVIYHNRDITKEEIKQILENSDVRNRAIFLMLYESGTRPITLVNLKWKHIKSDFGNVPMKIDLTSDILKCRVTQRFTLRLYCLRKAFRKFMASAVDSAYVEFWMGHTSTATHYLSRDIEHHRKLYQKGYENLRLYEIPREDIAKLKLENIEVRIQIEELSKRLEALERLLSRPSLQIDKEALSSAEKLARKLPEKYQAEA